MRRSRPNFALASALVAALASAGVARAAAPACELRQIGELPVQIDHGHLTVEAKINGHPVRMIVDTGSDTTLIFPASAKAFGLSVVPVRGVKFYGVGGESGAGTARVAEFDLGGMVARDVPLLVSGRHTLGDEQGLLGAGFLMQSDLELDVPDKRLRFFKPKNCTGDQVVYWGKAYSQAPLVSSTADKEINVSVRLNGVPVEAELDTGSDVSVLTPEAATRAGVKFSAQAADDRGPIEGLGSKLLPVSVGLFSTFAFGDETIGNAKLRIADLFKADTEVTLGSNIPRPVTQMPRMLLGADFVQAHRIYVSFGQRMVYASYIGGPVFMTHGSPPAATPPPAPPHP